MTKQFILTVAAFVACLGLTGCGGGKVTKSNFEKVTVGMSLPEVEAILGKGDEQASSAAGGPVSVPGMNAGGMSIPGQTITVPTMSVKIVVWKDGSKVISVSLLNDKVVSKNQSGL